MNLIGSGYHLASLFLALALSGCTPGENRWRSYEEVTVGPEIRATTSPARSAPSAPAASPARLAWKCPPGWTEESGSGMRMASFNVTRGGDTGTCTIISLSGAAGGLEANVQRWLGQLELPKMPPEEWAGFLGRQEKLTTAGGLELLMVDLTGLGEPDDGKPSILAGVVAMDQSTVFLKFNGPLRLIKAERNSFVELCRSLTLGPKD